MSAFSAANITKAIARVPRTSMKDLRALRERAIGKNLADLVNAIDAELRLRGTVEFDVSQAERHADWSAQAADLNLTETIQMAFSVAPANPDEAEITLRIYAIPGVSYQDLVTLRGKGDVGLILGHMVYERLGFFRKFLVGIDRMSDLLFDRGETNGQVDYRLTQEAERAFVMIGLVGSAR